MSEYTQAYMCDVVKKFLDGEYDGNKWRYFQDETFFSGGLGGLQGKVSELKFVITVGSNTVSCYHILPFKAEESQRAAVAEYITRANYNLNVGNFEMDFSDGELRYKTTLSKNDLLSNDKAALDSMKFMFTLGPMMWMRYGDNLASLLFGGAADKSVSELVEEAEEK